MSSWWRRPETYKDAQYIFPVCRPLSFTFVTCYTSPLSVLRLAGHLVCVELGSAKRELIDVDTSFQSFFYYFNFSLLYSPFAIIHYDLDMEYDLCVIDFFAVSGKGLNYHESPHLKNCRCVVNTFLSLFYWSLDCFAIKRWVFHYFASIYFEHDLNILCLLIDKHTPCSPFSTS